MISDITEKWWCLIQFDIYTYICIYGTLPRSAFQTNLVVFTVFFLTFWTLKLGAFLVIKNCKKLQVCSRPALPKHIGFKIQDPRFQKNFLNPKGVGFKIQDPQKTSWIRRPSALNLESKEVGLKKNMSLESWILSPILRMILVTGNCRFLQFLANDRPACLRRTFLK